MTIIFGEVCSGKSSLALEMAKKHIQEKYNPNQTNNNKVIYFSLDKDKSIKRKLDLFPNIEYKYIKSPIIFDIECSIEEDTSFIVIDPINMIRYNNSFILKDVIKDLEYIEFVHKVEIVAVFNTLKMFDSTSKNIIDVCKDAKVKIIETSK